MITLLISGSGTGVGKTRVTAALARALHQRGRSVQIIKPVQTGVEAGEPTDADIAAGLAHTSSRDALTLRRFPAALAPLAAAEDAGTELDPSALAREILALPSASVRLIEGAGGLAVPLWADGRDWVAFAAAARADAVLLVVPDELGAINQSRLAFHYLTAHRTPVPRGGIFLNALRPAPGDVRYSTRVALAETGVPLWGELPENSLDPAILAPLAEILGI